MKAVSAPRRKAVACPAEDRPRPPAPSKGPRRYYFLSFSCSRFHDPPGDLQLTGSATDAVGEFLRKSYLDREIFERVGPRLNDPTSRHVLAALATWLEHENRTADDVLILYFATHGDVIDDELWLYWSDSRPRDRRTALGINTVAEMIARSPVARALIVMDCCVAGQARQALDDMIVQNPLRKVDGPVVRDGGIYLLAAAGRSGKSAQAVLPKALTSAIDKLGADRPNHRYLTPPDLSSKINEIIENSWQRAHVQGACCGDGVPAIIPNPHFTGKPVGDVGRLRRSWWLVLAGALLATILGAIVAWPLFRGPDPATPRVTLDVPADGSAVPQHGEVRGRVTGLDRTRDLWIVVTPPLTARMFPQDGPALRSSDGTFIGPVTYGDDQRKSIGSYALRVVALDPSGSATLQRYFAKARASGSYPGVATLPAGTAVLATASVHRDSRGSGTVTFPLSADGRLKAEPVGTGANRHYRVVRVRDHHAILTTTAKYDTPNDVKRGAFTAHGRRFAAAYEYTDAGGIYTWIGVWSTRTSRRVLTLERRGSLDSLSGIILDGGR